MNENSRCRWFMKFVSSAFWAHDGFVDSGSQMAGDDAAADDRIEELAGQTGGVLNEEDIGQSFEVAPPDNKPGVICQLCTNPVNLALFGLCIFLVYKIVKSRRHDSAEGNAWVCPPMKKRDFTLEQLKEFDGQGPDGRILMAVNGKVFDVTKARKTYGPGCPYGLFAGHDASRGLGTFSLKEDVIRDAFDDLSDLTSIEMEKIREWEKQFQENYDTVGRLLREGEEPTDYSDTEEEQSILDKSKNY